MVEFTVYVVILLQWTLVGFAQIRDFSEIENSSHVQCFFQVSFNLIYKEKRGYNTERINPILLTVGLRFTCNCTLVHLHTYLPHPPTTQIDKPELP